MKRRQAPEINAGSMADIAFLLLIFWLVATTIKPEYGINSVLKDADEEPKIAIVTQSRDLLRVHVTEEGEYEVEINGTRTLSLDELRDAATRLRGRAGYKARVILTSDYNAPYDSYMGVLLIVKELNINIIENEIKEDTEGSTDS